MSRTVSLDESVDYVLRQEDSGLSGRTTNGPLDRGGRTRFGVTEKFHPNLTNLGFFDRMSREDALQVARKVYELQYASSLRLPFYKSQKVANALLSFAVNEGINQTIRLTQRALGVTVDGIFGENTLDFLNLSDENVFLANLYLEEIKFYKGIVEENPQQKIFLAGWTNRAAQNCMTHSQVTAT